MARKKVRLAWIPNDSARRSTLKKRKKGLMKKVSELSTLCGVEACAIVYAPHEPQPEVWPPSPSEVHRVLTRFKSMTGVEQSKKMMNQEDFLMQRILKVKQQLRKMQRENREYEITQLMHECFMGRGLHDVATDELNDMAWLIDAKAKEIEERIAKLRMMVTGSETTLDSRQEFLQLMNSSQEQQQQQQQQQWQQQQQHQLQLQQQIQQVLSSSHEQQQQQIQKQMQRQPQPIAYYGSEEDLFMPYGENAPWYNRFFP